MNPFLRYLADKHSAHTQTDRQTDRHTPMTTRPCGLRRAGNKRTNHKAVNFTLLSETMPGEHNIPQCLASVWRNTEFKDASKYR